MGRLKCNIIVIKIFNTGLRPLLLIRRLIQILHIDQSLYRMIIDREKGFCCDRA